MSARLGKEAMGRLVLEASTGMHGAVAKQLALELATALEAQQAGGEPVYQYQKADGSWVDQSEQSYQYNLDHGATNLRVLYTRPAPVQQVDAPAEAVAAAHELTRTLDHAAHPREDIDLDLVRMVCAALAAQPAAERLPNFIVSAVLVKDIPTGLNIMNKLYAVQATSQDEAHGKTLPMCQADFPEHRLHTICAHGITATSGKESGNG